MTNRIFMISILHLASSCSFFGIQNEQGPKYDVIVKDNDFEIRQYAALLSAQVTLKGDFNDSPGKAFKILAGYIFGKNESKETISMTTPVKMRNESVKIDITSPVKIRQGSKNYTMSFSMPEKYTLESLPVPKDERIKFVQIPSKIIASYKFSGSRSAKKNIKKYEDLKKWLQNYKQYQLTENYSFAGYNPPWTLPFFRRNEIHIELKSF